MQPRTMTPAECAALFDVEAAEQAVRDATIALEAARRRLTAVTRRERLRQRPGAALDTHLRLVVGSRP
jgi:hypothetical protein